MEKLTSPRVIKSILNEYDLHFNKRYGQNFLIDENIVNKIAETGEITRDDLILEIGPGIGTLTSALCKNAGKVISVEIDKKLIPVLNETLKEFENVEIIQEDILKLDIIKLLEKEMFCNFKIVANLPYYITTPIIMGFLEMDLDIEKMVFLIQKEVGERLCAAPGTKAYGSLSIAAQFYADVEIEFLVPAQVFMPKPKVDSIVVSMKKKKEPDLIVDNRQMFFKIVKAGFNNRRKTLINSLTTNTNFTKEQVLQALNDCGISPGIRGEALTGQEFAQLANYLNNQENLR
ncbi:MAG: rRNA (adenine1518-N6/adenine1519-N6)-dimethyltransferase [Eubacteriaceae bacterium]|jgi:16S rRNA (adenine1518-N6/adenine1519-N6)-dimethyltransferase|nr:rRNA (adenine1518-N6/adenine1519-N6)-dimethyltransferase [Eubacteriaceae bacterium]